MPSEYIKDIIDQTKKVSWKDKLDILSNELHKLDKEYDLLEKRCLSKVLEIKELLDSIIYQDSNSLIIWLDYEAIKKILWNNTLNERESKDLFLEFLALQWEIKNLLYDWELTNNDDVYNNINKYYDIYNEQIKKLNEAKDKIVSLHPNPCYEWNNPKLIINKWILSNFNSLWDVWYLELKDQDPIIFDPKFFLAKINNTIFDENKLIWSIKEYTDIFDSWWNQIYNIEKIYSKDVNWNEQFEFNLNWLNSGLYFIKILMPDNTILIKKVVKV